VTTYSIPQLRLNVSQSALVQMSDPLYRDPWAKREAWRKSPIFSNKAMFRCVGFDGHTIIAALMMLLPFL
jgi:hypothetical protein